MKYLVGFSYQETGRIVIEADTPEEAAEKLEEMLDYDGLPSDFDVTDRDYSVDTFDIKTLTQFATGE